MRRIVSSMGAHPVSERGVPQRVSALTTARVAHDLRVMLTVIASCSESLRRRIAHDDAEDRDFNELYGALESAFHLIHDLEDDGRSHTVGPPVVDLNELVLQAEGVLTRLLGPAFQLVLQLNAIDPVVEAAAAHLEWVVFNLVANSRDAMPEGGSITIETAATEFAASRRARRVRLSVIDSGSGIPGYARERLFEPFFTTKDGHAGLGLTSIGTIVRMLKGAVHVESGTPAGTRVDIYLPRLEPLSR